MSEFEHTVAVWDGHGCLVEQRRFAGRRQALHFADAELTRGREVRWETRSPDAAPAEHRSQPFGSWAGRC